MNVTKEVAIVSTDEVFLDSRDDDDGPVKW